jgi:hypothetical protein
LKDIKASLPIGFKIPQSIFVYKRNQSSRSETFLVKISLKDIRALLQIGGKILQSIYEFKRNQDPKHFWYGSDPHPDLDPALFFGALKMLNKQKFLSVAYYLP